MSHLNNPKTRHISPYMVTGFMCMKCNDILYPPEDTKEQVQRFSTTCSCSNIAINHLRVPRPKAYKDHIEKGHWVQQTEITFVYVNDPSTIEVFRSVVGSNNNFLNPKVLNIPQTAEGALGTPVPESIKQTFRDMMFTTQPPDLQRKIKFGGVHQEKEVNLENIRRLHKLNKYKKDT